MAVQLAYGLMHKASFNSTLWWALASKAAQGGPPWQAEATAGVMRLHVD